MTIEERAEQIWEIIAANNLFFKEDVFKEVLQEKIKEQIAEHNEQCALVADKWNSIAAAHISSDIRALLTPSVDQQAQDAAESQESQQPQTHNSPQ